MEIISFFPSIVFWTSQIGKDSLILFFLGLVAYSVASLSVRLRFHEVFYLLIGLTGTMIIRPHIASVAVMAVILAFIPLKGRRIVSSLFLLGVSLAASYIIVTHAASFLRINLSYESIQDYASERQDTNLDGGSSFQNDATFSLRELPLTIINLLIRPFPWESHNYLALIASLESSILLPVLMIRYIRNIINALLSVWKNGYIIFILSYIALFIFIMSTMSNLGILVRQRVMMLPFLLMLIAYRNNPVDETLYTDKN
jgi:hypothetical protein